MKKTFSLILVLTLAGTIFWPLAADARILKRPGILETITIRMAQALKGIVNNRGDTANNNSGTNQSPQNNSSNSNSGNNQGSPTTTDSTNNSGNNQTSQNPLTFPLMQKENLIYEGAFALPTVQNQDSRFNYGTTALAYNPQGNSLFLVGHDWHQLTSEVSIPQLKKNENRSELQVATQLQPFTDPSEGMMFAVDEGSIKAGDYLVYNGKLYGSVYTYYDANGNQPFSHFISPLNITIPGDAKGMYKVGDLKTGYTSGYMENIPQEWQSLLGGPALAGNCCIPIVSRTSYGPAVFVFNPENLGQTEPLPATPLVYYPSEHPLAGWDETSPYFNGSSGVAGVLIPAGSRSVLFLGKHGTGEFCYGTGAECNDPVYSSKGTHSYPYVYQVWAYDLIELLKVKNGEKQPWEVKPYAVWNFDLPFGNETKQIAGTAYDMKNNRLYISHVYNDATVPVIQVFSFQK